MSLKSWKTAYSDLVANKNAPSIEICTFGMFNTPIIHNESNIVYGYVTYWENECVTVVELDAVRAGNIGTVSLIGVEKVQVPPGVEEAIILWGKYYQNRKI
jgi:hypothetical protein